MHSILEELSQIDALQFGDFVLASGVTSKFYLDLRLIPSYPKLFQTVTKELGERSKNLTFDIITGIPTAGVPFGTALAILLQKPLIQIRKEPKDHGMGKMIEGISVKGKTVLLVDDVISSGSSNEFAIQLLRDAGATVEELLVIVDRRLDEQASKEWEQTMKITVSSVFKLSAEEILSFGKDHGLLKE